MTDVYDSCPTTLPVTCHTKLTVSPANLSIVLGVAPPLFPGQPEENATKSCDFVYVYEVSFKSTVLGLENNPEADG